MISITANDTSKEATAFAKEVKATFPVIMDPRADIFDQYGVTLIPANYLIDRTGKVIAMPESEKAIKSAVIKAMKK